MNDHFVIDASVAIAWVHPAQAHHLSVYDAAYLELAIRRKLPLGCKAGTLREAARKCGVKLL